MKVYVKKGECTSILPALVVMLFFFGYSLSIFSYWFSKGNFLYMIKNAGIVLLFSFFFFDIALFLLIQIFKSPKKLRAQLVTKQSSLHNGRDITYMIFSTISKNNKKDNFSPTIYKCFTYGDNILAVNSDYIIKVKEFNWKIVAVEETGIVDDTDYTQEPSANLKKFPILRGIPMKIGNLALFNEIEAFLLASLLWIFFIFIVFSINFLGIKELNSTIQTAIILLPLAAILSNIVAGIFSYIDIDDKLMEKFKLEINPEVNFTAQKVVYIFRPVRNTFCGKFFIIDHHRNLLYKIQKSGVLMPKFIIMDNQDNKIGEINLISSFTDAEYIIRLFDQEPYSIKVNFHSFTFTLTGRDYIIKGDVTGNKNLICNLNNNARALVSKPLPRDVSWPILGSSDLTFMHFDSFDLYFIAFCINHGNFLATMKKIRKNNNE